MPNDTIKYELLLAAELYKCSAAFCFREYNKLWCKRGVFPRGKRLRCLSQSRRQAGFNKKQIFGRSFRNARGLRKKPPRAESAATGKPIKARLIYLIYRQCRGLRCFAPKTPPFRSIYKNLRIIRGSRIKKFKKVKIPKRKNFSIFIAITKKIC